MDPVNNPSTPLPQEVSDENTSLSLSISIEPVSDASDSGIIGLSVESDNELSGPLPQELSDENIDLSVEPVNDASDSSPLELSANSDLCVEVEPVNDTSDPLTQELSGFVDLSVESDNELCEPLPLELSDENIDLCVEPVNDTFDPLPEDLFANTGRSGDSVNEHEPPVPLPLELPGIAGLNLEPVNEPSETSPQELSESTDLSMSPVGQPAGRHCAYCLVFTSAKKLLICGRCNRRAYCSRECQVKDWTVKEKFGQIHKIWCKLECGEEGLDWEVVPVEGMGLGIVAKRLIPAQYRIMVDPVRPISHPRVQDFSPTDGNSLEKVKKNSFIVDNCVIPLVCLRLARINHNCNPNAGFSYDPSFDVVIVSAQRDIQEGEEIFLNYRPINDIHATFPIYMGTLRDQYGIECLVTCYCRNLEFLKRVRYARSLNIAAITLGRNRRICEALNKYDTLLEIEKKINCSYNTISGTLYAAAKLAINYPTTRHRAEAYLRQLYDMMCQNLYSPQSECVLKIKSWITQYFGG